MDALSQLWQRRIQERIPIQQLVGITPWHHLSLRVTPDVLIPRPETEWLVELAIAAAPAEGDLSLGDWADLGTGSGAIALALASALPHVTLHAVDCSAEALAVAQTNAQLLGLTPRIQFYQGRWLQPLVALRGQLQVIVSNPPYIPTAMIPHLQPEVAWYEPHLALDGGSDGLDAIRHIIATAPDYLRSGGLLLLEMMAGTGRSRHPALPSARPV